MLSIYLSFFFHNLGLQNKFLKLATTKKTSIKKTTSKKDVNDKLSPSKQEDSLLKKNGIDDMSLDDLIKFYVEEHE